MLKGVILLIVVLLTCAQQYLPLDPRYLPITDLYAKDMARSGTDTFWRTKTNAYTTGTLISSYPVRPNAVTKVTVYLEVGDQFHIAVGQKNVPLMYSKGDPFHYPNTVTYWTLAGTKCVAQN